MSTVNQKNCESNKPNITSQQKGQYLKKPWLKQETASKTIFKQFGSVDEVIKEWH